MVGATKGTVWLFCRGFLCHGEERRNTKEGGARLVGTGEPCSPIYIYIYTCVVVTTTKYQLAMHKKWGDRVLAITNA
jgi:hypothetical protein